MIPPLTPPPDATGNPPILNLAVCQDNDTGSSALTPVSTFVQHIRSLKADPDNQILVGAITGPTDPYGVVWMPATGSASGESWPQVIHSCGAQGGDDVNPMSTMHPTDGSFGDPAVRIAQFVTAFPNSVLASICDASYRAALQAMANKLISMMSKQLCVPLGTIQNDPQGQPTCTVTAHLGNGTGQTTDVQVPLCAEDGNTAPCWTLYASTICPSGAYQFVLTPDQAIMNAASLSTTVKCSLCQPGPFVMPGC
jgi:hypothetical protein